MHITGPGEQSEVDLGQIVDEINCIYARKGVDFVFLPGDIADDGSALAYRTVRAHLDRLAVPWYAITGDHDVHERSFANFQSYMAADLHSAFTLGHNRFFRLNAFSRPAPDSFHVSDEQLDWLEKELLECGIHNRRAVLLLHCYPSDLKQGGLRLSQLLGRYPVLLVDMGHTHYNELSNDGKVIYSATRSTGQIEEGPVGYSITTLDADVVSWNFVRLGSPSVVTITSPPDYRLSTSRTPCTPVSRMIEIRAKIWSPFSVCSARGYLEGKQVDLRLTGGVLWSGLIDASHVDDGIYSLGVTATDSAGDQISSEIRLALGDIPPRTYSAVDQENAVGAWTERDILGTQLGPNKNGHKW